MDKLDELKVKFADASIQLEIAQNIYNTVKKNLIEGMKQNGKKVEKEEVEN